MLAALAVEFWMEAVIDEGVLVEGGDQMYGAAVSAVTATGAATGDEFFAPEGEAAIAAVARHDTNVDFVDEQLGLVRDSRDDADEPAALALVTELDGAGDLGEKRVVLAESDVQAWLELATALADQDRAARNELAVVFFHTKPLRVTVASVA